MITMRDLLEQGVEIQGNVKVQTYHHDKEEIEILYVGEGENIYETEEESFIDMEIGFIFPDRFEMDRGFANGVCFEVRKVER